MDVTGADDAGVLTGVEADLLFVVEDEDFVLAGALLVLGAGGADFSVVMETLGSDFSGGVASGAAARVGVSSWAHASGATLTKRAVRAMMVVFIGRLPVGLSV
ncbi:MAG: hypothetical protein M3N12_08355 [Verrucomicrobiota bacterium]|nr:hypothetical protein [Verrucomicrobiota bacterium]